MAPMRLMRALAPAMAEAGRRPDRERRAPRRASAPRALERRLLGDEGGPALAQPRVRRPLGGRGRAGERGGAGAGGRPSCGPAEGGLADQIAARTGADPRRGARGDTRRSCPWAAWARGRDRRRDRVPLLGAGVERDRRRAGRSTAAACRPRLSLLTRCQRVRDGADVLPARRLGQVARYLARSLPDAGWDVTRRLRLARAARASRRTRSTFFAGLDVRALDYTPPPRRPTRWRPTRPSTPRSRTGRERRTGCSRASDDATYEHLVEAWAAPARRGRARARPTSSTCTT